MKSADWRPRGCDESQESADGSSMVTIAGLLLLTFGEGLAM